MKNGINCEHFQEFYNLYIKELEHNIDYGMRNGLITEIDNNLKTNEMYSGLYSEISDLIDGEIE